MPPEEHDPRHLPETSLSLVSKLVSAARGDQMASGGGAPGGDAMMRKSKKRFRKILAKAGAVSREVTP
jgi:hypothetical protein